MHPDAPLVGQTCTQPLILFASRTPDRLTPIGVTEVELLEVRGTTLAVRNLDAFNGTSVLDIKVGKSSLKRSREQRDSATPPR